MEIELEQPPVAEKTTTDRLKASLWRSVRLASGGWRRVAALALGVSAAVAVVAAVYYFVLLPSRTIAVLPFRITFDTAAPKSTDAAEQEEELKKPKRLSYPNGLPFAPSDVIGVTIVERAFQTTGLEEYCKFEDFRRGLVVQEGAMERQMLDQTYQPLLGNVRLTPMERIQLEEQYRARVNALPAEYQLTFVAPAACSRIPSDLQKAVLAHILETWAEESESKRGVLEYHIGIVRPSIFDEPGLGQPRVVRLNRVRSSIQRALQVLDQMAELPGALSVRSVGSNAMTLPEIRGRLVDLRVGVVEPLIAQEARVSGSGQWLQEARLTARRQKEAAQIQAEAYRTALREFSGSPQALSAANAERPRLGTSPLGGQGSETQALIPQLDRSFIDRIVQLSTQTSAFRQELTEEMVKAEVDAITFRSDEAYYEQVLQGGGTTLGGAAPVDEQLTAAIGEGRRLVGEMNILFAELNRVGLRPSGALYASSGGARVSRTWPIMDFLQLIAATLLIALFMIATTVLANEHFRAVSAARKRNGADEA